MEHAMATMLSPKSTTQTTINSENLTMSLLLGRNDHRCLVRICKDPLLLVFPNQILSPLNDLLDISNHSRLLILR